MTGSAVATVQKYKFQKLDVYQLALEYLDLLYRLSKKFPSEERYNLASQLQRAATSIVLNISEGSTGQSDAEQNRFLGLAMRSYLETVACLDIAQRRVYLEKDEANQTTEFSHRLFVNLQSLGTITKRNLMVYPVTRPRSPVYS